MKKSLLLAGLCLLGLSLVATGAAQAGPVFESAPFGGKSQPVPAGAKLTLQPRRATYLLGENVIADFRLENVGQTPFAISVGGDYRGGTRANRFKISARDASGQPVADPSPTENNFGGLGGSVLIKPGQIWTQTLSLLPYLRLEAPGEYQISATHDFGCKVTEENPLPIAQATIQLQMPTPEQARQIVAKIVAMPKVDGVSMGQRNPNEWADFSALHYPVYLPIIARQIRAGDARTLPSVAKLETPEATRLLIELLDAKPEIARQAAAYLTARLPVNDADPMIPAALADRPELREFRAQRRERVERSWRPEFAAPTLDYARRALQSDERETLRLGAHLMMNLGAAPDYSLVIAALGQRLPLTAKKPCWQFVGNDRDNTMEGWQLQDDCLELARAALQIRRRDAATPPGGNTAADAVVEIVGMKTDPARLEKRVGRARHAVFARKVAVCSATGAGKFDAALRFSKSARRHQADETNARRARAFARVAGRFRHQRARGGGDVGGRLARPHVGGGCLKKSGANAQQLGHRPRQPGGARTRSFVASGANLGQSSGATPNVPAGD